MSTRRSSRRARQRATDSDTGATEESAAETDTELMASQLGPVVEAVTVARDALAPHDNAAGQPVERLPAAAAQAAATDDRPLESDSEAVTQLQNMKMTHQFENTTRDPPANAGRPQEESHNDGLSDEDTDQQDDNIYIVENGERRLMNRLEWYDQLISEEDEPAAPPPSRYLDCRELLALSPTLLRGRLAEVEAAIPFAHPRDVGELRNRLAIATALQAKREMKQEIAAAHQERRVAREAAAAEEAARAREMLPTRRLPAYAAGAASARTATSAEVVGTSTGTQVTRRAWTETAARPTELMLPAASARSTVRPLATQAGRPTNGRLTAANDGRGDHIGMTAGQEARGKTAAVTTVEAVTAPPEYFDLEVYFTFSFEEMLEREDEIRRAMSHAHPEQAADLLYRLNRAHRCLPPLPAAAPATGHPPQVSAARPAENPASGQQGVAAGSVPLPRDCYLPAQRPVDKRPQLEPQRRHEIAGHTVPRNTSTLSHRPYVAPRGYPDEVRYDTDSEPATIRARRLRQAPGPHRVRSLAERLASRSRSPLVVEPGSRVGRSKIRDRLRPTYNPMRVHSPWNKRADQTRRQARRALYDAEYGKPEGDNYPSSDTDWSEDYTTEQEGFVEVEARYAGNTNENDWREWPWPKMRKVLKEMKRHYRPMVPDADSRKIVLLPEGIPRNLPAAAKEYVRQLQDELVRFRQKASKHERERGRSCESCNPGRKATGSKSRSSTKRDQSVDSEGDRQEARHSRSKTKHEELAASDTSKKHRRQPARSVSEGRRKPRSRLTTSRKSAAGQAFESDSSSADDSDNSEAEAIPPPAPVAPVASRSVASGFMGDVHKTSLEIPVFYGENWPTFRNQFERVADHLCWTPDEKAVYLHNAIRGDAAKALSSPESKNWSYEKIVEHMEMRHGKNKTYGDVFLELMTAYRRPGQSIASWNDQVIGIVNTGQLSDEQTQAAAFDGFLYGLRGNTGLYNKVASARVQTIEEAFKIAQRWERNHGSRPYVSPAGVNMLAAGEQDGAAGDAARAPGSLKLALQKTSGPLTMKALADFAQQLGGRIEGVGETLSERFDKRFDDLSGRVTHLETRVNQGSQDVRPPRNNYNNGGGAGGYNRNYNGNNAGGGYRRGGYNNYRGQNRNNDGYRRDDRDRNNERAIEDDSQRRNTRGGQRSRSPDRRGDARQQAGQYREELRQRGGDRADDRRPDQQDRRRQSDSRGGQSPRE